jgi:hypothetical protein
VYVAGKSNQNDGKGSIDDAVSSQVNRQDEETRKVAEINPGTREWAVLVLHVNPS